MSRSGYSDDCDGWELIMWRGAVNQAINGKRGQAFLKELLVSLDALSKPKLIAHYLMKEGEVCAIGAVGWSREIDMTGLDPEYSERIADTFGVANALVKEIEFENDECGPGGYYYHGPEETSEERFIRVRKWVESQIRQEVA